MMPAAALSVAALGGCAGVDTGQSAELGAAPAVTIPISGPRPTGDYGAYLSGEIALAERDTPAALTFFQDALAHDPGNQDLALRVFVVAMGDGRLDIAEPVGAKLLRADPKTPLPNLLQAVIDLRDGRATQAYAHAGNLPNSGFYRFLAGFFQAWTLYAAHGSALASVAALGVGVEDQALAPLIALHTALIEDLAGDSKDAAAAYETALGQGRQTLRVVQLAGNFYERNGLTDKAKELYQTFAAEGGSDTGLSPALTPHGPPPRLIHNAADGLAEGLFDIASIMGQQSAPDVARVAARLALALRPDFALAQLVLGGALEAEGRDTAALAVYRGIDHASPFGWVARLREAAALDRMGDDAAAERSLREMAAERPAQVEPLVQLGNVLRGHDQFAEAAGFYSEALGRVTDPSADRYWPLYFGRGIAYERAGQWFRAESDLRTALHLAPNDPDVLNYLGFALADRKERLPEAISLIKRAVEIRPDDGFIVDSLGWAYFRVGDFSEAATTLEHAVELRPGDPEINDHLGDAYWQDGRAADAKLQWRRALSLKPDPALAKSIEAKLDHPPAAQHPPLALRRGT